MKCPEPYKGNADVKLLISLKIESIMANIYLHTFIAHDIMTSFYQNINEPSDLEQGSFFQTHIAQNKTMN